MKVTALVTLCNISLIRWFFLSTGGFSLPSKDYAPAVKFPNKLNISSLSEDISFASDVNVLNLEKEENDKLPIPNQIRVKRMGLHLGIFPGTKWCGPGNISESYSDLGSHRREDKCCREHDHCPRNMPKNSCKQDLCNWSLFTRSHCHCDEKFRICLENIHTKTAEAIQTMFFVANRRPCFREKPPCEPWQGKDSDKNNATCKLEFSSDYGLIPVDDIIQAKICVAQRIIPGQPKC